jgi:hypothetical protein
MMVALPRGVATPHDEGAVEPWGVATPRDKKTVVPWGVATPPL